MTYIWCNLLVFINMSNLYTGSKKLCSEPWDDEKKASAEYLDLKVWAMGSHSIEDIAASK